MNVEVYPGSLFVPSGQKTFRLDLESGEVEVQHASRRFRNPHWTLEYRMVKIEDTFLEMEHSYSIHDDTLYYHISQFKPIVK